MLNWYWITWAFLLAEFAVRIALAVRIVMRRAPVPTILGWLVLILLVPFLGIPLYILIGEVRLGSRRIRRYAEVARGLEERAHVFWRGGPQDWTAEVAPYKHIAQLLTAIGEMPPLVGNKLDILAATDRMIAALVADIDNSRRWCHLVSYIWAPDASGTAVGEALIRAAGRGVECRVLVDAAGSRRFLRSPLAARMRDAGVKIRGALPANIVRALFERVDIRNHRKIAVIDGWVAHTGSHNITDASYGYNPRTGIGPWIDASVRIEGPSAQALEVVLLRDWEMERDEPLPTTLPLEALFPQHALDGGGSIVQVVPTGPVPRPDAIQEALLTTIYAARREIILTTPYFLPDDPTKMALICAARIGVAVTLVVPARLDGRLVAAASKSHYAELLEAGVTIMEHAPGLLHAKTMTVDTDVAVIGSANLDIRSFRLNFEVSLFVFDADFASLLRMLQVEYIGQSTALNPDEWRRRARWPRFKESLSRLASPLL